MEFALEFIINLVYVRCFICIGDSLLALERRHHKFENIVWIALTFLTSVACVYAGTGIQLVSHVLCVMVILSFFFKEKKKILVGVYIGTVAILLLFLTLFKTVISELIKYLQFSEMKDMTRLIANIVMFLLVWAIGKYYKNKYPIGLKNIGIRYLFFLAFIVLGNALILMLFTDVVHEAEVSRKWVLIIVYIGVVIGILMQIILLINAIITRNVYKENEVLAKQYLDAQNEHYLYLEKREYETKSFRHDIRNHLIVLENCIKNKEYIEAEQYLGTLNEKVDSFSNHISVNNGIADAILNKFYWEAKEEGIELLVKGYFPPEYSLPAFEMCTILSNLLSNAILAESQCEGQQVLVEIKHTKDYVWIRVENEFNHELQREDGVLKTTKSDSLNHGFGLCNIKDCVERMDGEILFSTNDGLFRVTVRLENK